jgi:hypothetical protein
MNEEIMAEQPAPDAPTFVDNAPDGSVILGKFASAAELEKAYLSLQAEFTRKSQQLAQLQSTGNAGAAKEQTPEPIVKGPDREQVIQEYLISLVRRETTPAVITTGVGAAYGTKPMPRTLADMEKVASDFFRTKQKGE